MCLACPTDLPAARVSSRAPCPGRCPVEQARNVFSGGSAAASAAREAPRRPEQMFGEGAEHCTRGARALQAKQILGGTRVLLFGELVTFVSKDTLTA